MIISFCLRELNVFSEQLCEKSSRSAGRTSPATHQSSSRDLFQVQTKQVACGLNLSSAPKPTKLATCNASQKGLSAYMADAGAGADRPVDLVSMAPLINNLNEFK